MHSVKDIQVPAVSIRPKTFRFPNVHSTLSSLSREVFSGRGSTVGTGFIVCSQKSHLTPVEKGTRQGKMRSQNLDEI